MTDFSCERTQFRFGIDLGGTKIELIALDRHGKEMFRRRKPTPKGDYQETLSAILELVEVAESDLGARGTVGIGTPGTLSVPAGVMKNSNSVCLNGQPLLDDLRVILNREVRIRNDADCFALSEATDGSAAGFGTVFGVILGTGVGGGVVVNGRLLNGPNGIAGEWGHNNLPWPVQSELPGAECYCGQRGCIETYLSGPGLTNDHYLMTGQTLQVPEILERSLAGDLESEATLRRYENRLARSLASVINLLDPDALVLGGGLSNLGRLYDNVPKIWQQYIFSNEVRTLLLPPRFGDSSGVRGAAWLWGEES